jgi:cis-L-3-hydroxyproline dehydratase
VNVVGLRMYRQMQPFRDGVYATAAGHAEGFDSTIVALDTDDGVTGWGEMAPLGSFYSDAFAAGARAGIEELAPLVVGTPVSHPRRLMRLLNQHMRGQPYVKSAIDMAAWDLYGRAAGRPLSDLLGGGDGETVALYRPIPPHLPAGESAAAYVAEGYRRLQVKVGADPLADAERVREVRRRVPADVAVFADANGAWTTSQARRFLHATRDLDLTMEQPCATYAACTAIRAACSHPLILDESIESLDVLLRAIRDGVADGATLKLSRLGGLTPTILLRDAAAELGLPTTIEDTGGGSIDTAATLHAAVSTPEPLRIHTVDFTSWITADHGAGVPAPAAGRIAAPSGSGLGVEVDEDVLGTPIFTT